MEANYTAIKIRRTKYTQLKWRKNLLNSKVLDMKWRLEYGLTVISTEQVYY